MLWEDVGGGDVAMENHTVVSTIPVTESAPSTSQQVGLSASSAPTAEASFERPDDEPRIMWLIWVTAVLVFVGVLSRWSSGSGVTLNGLEGSNNGWMVLLAAVVMASVARSVSRGEIPGCVLAGFVSLQAVATVVRSSGPPDLGLAWGWWLSLLATLVWVAGFGWGVLHRVTARSQGRTVTMRRTVVRKVGPWAATVMVVLFIVVSGVARYVLIVEEHQSWPPPSDAVTAEDAQAFTESFVADRRGRGDLDIAYAPSVAASFDPQPEGDNFFPMILDDVGAATESVHILMYGFSFTQVGTKLKGVLLDKLHQGVEVRVVVDSYGSHAFSKNEADFTDLADAGAQIVVNDDVPIDRDGLYLDRSIDWGQREVGSADHRKLLIIDGVTAWNGGAGFEDHFWNGGFHDVMVRVTGDVVRQAQALFLTSFFSHGGPLSDDLGPYFPNQPQAGTIPVTVLQVVPHGFNQATQAVREVIDNAQDRVDIMNPYMTDADMIQRLVNAAKRGVKVRIVVSETSNNAIATSAARHHYGDLIDAGAEVWEYPNAVTHAKVVVADDVVVFGTLNFDAWSLYRDYEVSMRVESAELAATFEERLFEPDIATSKPGEPASGVWQSLGSWISDKLAYFF